MLKRVGSAARLVITHPSTSFPRFRLTQNAVQSVEYITLCEDRDISLFSLPPSRELHVVWRDKGGDATMSLPTTLFSLSLILLFDRAAVYHHQLLDTAARGEGNQRERERENSCVTRVRYKLVDYGEPRGSIFVSLVPLSLPWSTGLHATRLCCSTATRPSRSDGPARLRGWPRPLNK